VLAIAVVAALFAAGIAFYGTHNGVIGTDNYETPAGPSGAPATK
jgi:hypothetical protein